MKKNIKNKLDDLKASNNYRVRRAKDSGNSHIFRFKGNDYLSFASNDYLSLTNDVRIVESAKKALDIHGYSVSSSALISGYSRSHMLLEERAFKLSWSRKKLYFTLQVIKRI